MYVFERKLNTYFSCQDCLDRYPCHVDCMVDYLNEQYDLLESGSVESLETYQDSMNRSAEDAVRTDTYMSVARAAAAVMSAEEYIDGGTVTAPVAPPMLSYPHGIAMGSDGRLVGPDGVVMGSEEDMAFEPVFRESDPVHMHPDFAGATGPVLHGPDPRMAPHLMP